MVLDLSGVRISILLSHIMDSFLLWSNPIAEFLVDAVENFIFKTIDFYMIVILFLVI